MIWLIGNRGMLGSDVETVLIKNSIDFIATDKEIDITDYTVLFDFANDRSIDWVINCAAYTTVDRAEDEPELAFKINAEGALNIARACKEIKAKLIHISTDYVFDGKKEGGYTENDQPNPSGVYGKSKLKGERHVERTLKAYFILRTAWLYGKNGGSFVHTMLRLFQKRDLVNVVSDQYGSPTYTKDLAGAIIKIIKSRKDTYGIYHFTNGGKTTWYEFAREIYKSAKKYGIINKETQIVPISTDEYPTKAKRPQNSYLSKEKITKAFKIDIRNWKEALSDFMRSEILKNRI